jgi:predicted site-specific integrase-resolvase
VEIHATTLRNWAVAGKIDFIQTPCGKRMYNKCQVLQRLGVDEQETRRSVVYARVSSSHQKEDLDRQLQRLQSEFPSYDTYSDIGSGLNWHRKGLRAILEGVYNNDIGEVVVTYRDRLCRFGFELLEWIFEKHRVKLVVLDSLPPATTENGAGELAEDLLAITTYFVAKNNGRRAGRNRKLRLKHNGHPQHQTEAGSKSEGSAE